MKNRHIHFILASLVFYSVLAAGTGAQAAEPAAKKSSAWHLVLEPLFGIKNGTVGEYVYSNDTKLSELDWDIKDIWYAGGNVSITYKRLSFSLGITKSFSKRSGDMCDSDWANLDNMQTNYSISENTLSSYNDILVSLSFTFTPLPVLTISPFSSLNYNYFSFEARNGYGWYGDSLHSKNGKNVDYTSDYATYYAKGSLLGIDYSREAEIQWLGCSISWIFFDKLKIAASPAVALYMTAKSIDRHYKSIGSNYYKDETDGWFSAFKIDAEMEYYFTRIFSISLSGTYAISKIVHGKTYYSSTGSNYQEENDGSEAGASFKYYGASLSVKFQPF